MCFFGFLLKKNVANLLHMIIQPEYLAFLGERGKDEA